MGEGADEGGWGKGQIGECRVRGVWEERSVWPCPERSGRKGGGSGEGGGGGRAGREGVPRERGGEEEDRLR